MESVVRRFRTRLITVRDGMDSYAPDAARRCLDHLEDGAVIRGEALPGLRNCLSERHAEARDRCPISPHRQIEVQIAIDLAHRGPALNQNRPGGLAREELLRNVILVHDVADELLDQ